jgi:hypothetical protein
MNPICVGIWFCSSYKLWLTIWDIVSLSPYLCSTQFLSMEKEVWWSF